MKVKIDMKDKKQIGLTDLRGKQIGVLDLEDTNEYEELKEGDIVDIILKKTTGG